jgi:hypothetical protein
MKTKTKAVVQLNRRDARYLADTLISFAQSELPAPAVKAFPAAQVMRLGMAAQAARVPEAAKECESMLRIWTILNEGVKLGRHSAARKKAA